MLPYVLLSAALAVAAWSTPATTTTASDTQRPLTPCQVLRSAFPGSVFEPAHGEDGSTRTDTWAGQQQIDLLSGCRFFPNNSRHVQQAVADVIIPYNLTLAVVSGERSSDDLPDVTFDLTRLDEINFFLDAGKEVWLGPGARWETVYSVLQPSNLSVAGPVISPRGSVSGHVLGGGVSWFAGRLGWACDALTELELVTPNAEILYVKPHKFDDLFWALRGSLGAFGIVTRIKVRTVQNDAVHAGALFYARKDLPQLCAALEQLALAATDDTASQGFLVFTWTRATQFFSYTAHLLNTNDILWPPSLSGFQSIPSISGSLQTTTIGDTARELEASLPHSPRRSRFTLTTIASSSSMLTLHDLLPSSSSLDYISLTLHPLTIPNLLSQNNIFHIGPARGPLLLAVVELGWSDTDRDGEYEALATQLREKMQRALRELGALDDFVHPKYAARDQQPFAALSPATKRALHETLRKYDPGNSWRRLRVGGWDV